jgi:hypothetical protein
MLQMASCGIGCRNHSGHRSGLISADEPANANKQPWNARVFVSLINEYIISLEPA